MSEKNPYEKLGSELKELRVKSKETLAEVSGAVEVQLDELTKIEEGESRPSEDVLSLIISHFDLRDSQAEKLWKLAGYDKIGMDDLGVGQPETNVQQTVLVTAFDARIVYADMIHVMSNKYGVVLNFMQGAGPNNQPLAISRIGMSKEHARSIIEVLTKTLDESEKADKRPPKRLSAPEDSKPQK